MILLWTLSIILPLSYMMFLLWLAKGWYFPKFHKRHRPLASGIKVSVVVAFRNEAGQLEQLFTSFRKQSYPSHLVEYILVNDHSEDQSEEEVQQQASLSGLNIILLSLEEGSRGKKAAISKAIARANGDLIITTDADCTAGPEWINTIVEHYRFYSCKMIVGGVKYKAENHWQRLQQLEFQSLIGTGACMAGLGLPLMSNGANLAYERTVFTDLEGYKGTPDTASGDDLFLMYRLHKHHKGSIHFLHEPVSYVSTQPSPDLSSFLQQRKRWAGKWSYYALPWAKALPVLLFLYYLLLLSIWIGALIMLSWSVFLLSFALKALADRFWLVPVCDEARFRVNNRMWILLSFLYPFYAVFFGIFSKMGRYRWKGRELNS